MTRLSMLLALATLPLAAQSPRERLLVSAEWLAQHVNDPNLVLLHVGFDTAYARAHIPGARFVRLQGLARPRVQGELALELPEPSVLQDSLRALGINQDSRIVVYWSNQWVTPTTRVIFTLDWAGLGDRTVLLEGGLDAWTAAGHPVTTEVPTPRPGTVTVRPRADRVVQADEVQRMASRPAVRVLDARSPAYYDGVQADQGRNGHVPGAASLPWADLFTDDARLRPASELTARFAEAGVRPGDQVVVYCHIGQYATAVIFAARSLGHDVRLYDGAFQDWAQRGLPVEATNR